MKMMSTPSGKKRKIDDAVPSKTSGNGKKRMTKKEKQEALARAQKWSSQQQQRAGANPGTPSRVLSTTTNGPISLSSSKKTTKTPTKPETAKKTKLREAQERAALWDQQERNKMKHKENEIASPPDPEIIMKPSSASKILKDLDNDDKNTAIPSSVSPEEEPSPTESPSKSPSSEGKKAKSSVLKVIVKSLIPILLIWGLSELLPYVDNDYVQKFVPYDDISLVGYIKEKLIPAIPLHLTAAVKKKKQMEEPNVGTVTENNRGENDEEEDEEYSSFEYTADDVHQLAADNNVVSLKSIIDTNPELSTAYDAKGWQPIHEAARACASGVLYYLLEDFNYSNMVDVNAPTRTNPFQLTPLGIATEQCENDDERSLCIAILKDKGGKLSIDSVNTEEEKEEEDGEIEEENARETMPEEEEEDVVDFTENDIREAASWGEFHNLKRFINLRPQWVNSADHNGWAALHEATRRKDLQCIKYLIEVAEANVHLETVHGETALDLSIEFNGADSEITTYLRGVMQ